VPADVSLLLIANFDPESSFITRLYYCQYNLTTIRTILKLVPVVWICLIDKNNNYHISCLSKHCYIIYHCKRHITAGLVQTSGDRLSPPYIVLSQALLQNPIIANVSLALGPIGTSGDTRHQRWFITRSAGDAITLFLYSYLTIPNISLLVPLSIL